jgi:hypothetical protein
LQQEVLAQFFPEVVEESQELVQFPLLVLLVPTEVEGNIQNQKERGDKPISRIVFKELPHCLLLNEIWGLL